MRIKVNGTLQFQESQVVLERCRIIGSVDDNSFDILRYGALLLKLSRDVEFSKHGHQIRQESNERNGVIVNNFS